MTSFCTNSNSTKKLKFPVYLHRNNPVSPPLDIMTAQQVALVSGRKEVEFPGSMSDVSLELGMLQGYGFIKYE